MLRILNFQVSELNHTLRKAVTEGYRRLGVPTDYHLPRRGLVRVAITLHILYGDLLELDDTSLDAQLIAGIFQRPFGNEDPVAAVISSLIVEDELPQEEAAVLRELLSSKSLLRQRNICLIEAVVQQTAALAMSLGYLGDTRLLKSTEFGRFSTYRLCLDLDATECCGVTRNQILESARKSIEQSVRLLGDLSPRKTPLFRSNWLCTNIKRRPPWTLLSWLLRLDHVSSSEINRHLSRAARGTAKGSGR